MPPVGAVIDAVALGDFGSDLCVGAGDLVGQGLANIVQQPPHLGHLDVGPGLGSQHPGQKSDLNGMLQHVFAIAVTIFELPQQPDQLPVQTADANVEGGLFAGLHNRLVNFVVGAVHHVLDAGRLYAPVGDQLFQRQPGDFPSHRVEAGNSHCFGSVINNDVYSGKGFQGTNVASFTADETAFSSHRWAGILRKLCFPRPRQRRDG